METEKLRGNEHCIRECEKQGPCECCTEFKGNVNYHIENGGESNAK
jgi:hypothetical protein